jgi:hypothetical protein
MMVNSYRRETRPRWWMARTLHPLTSVLDRPVPSVLANRRRIAVRCDTSGAREQKVNLGCFGTCREAAEAMLHKEKPKKGLSLSRPKESFARCLTWAYWDLVKWQPACSNRKREELAECGHVHSVDYLHDSAHNLLGCYW